MRLLLTVDRHYLGFVSIDNLRFQYVFPAPKNQETRERSIFALTSQEEKGEEDTRVVHWAAQAVHYH